MADIRSLLRNELATRKGAPQAGTANRATKKRKVERENVEDLDLTRKRMRATDIKPEQQQPSVRNVQPPSAQALAEGEEEEGMEHGGKTAGPELEAGAGGEEEGAGADMDVATAPRDSTKTQAGASQAVDEDEWAAFERDVAAPTRVPQAPAAVAAEATISAAPVSTEELTSQQQRENESAARTRETEVEGEREDAARFMEDEFDEMEQLEERVRRLKEKREELRKKKASDEAEAEKNEPLAESKAPGGGAGADSDDDDDDADADDDWDNWRFR